MNKYKVLNLELTYIKLMIRIYKLTLSILPKLSTRIKSHIEKVSLKSISDLNKIVSET